MKTENIFPQNDGLPDGLPDDIDDHDPLGDLQREIARLLAELSEAKHARAKLGLEKHRNAVESFNDWEAAI